MTKMLCIVSQPPYGSTHSLELIETAMVGAVFDFQVSLLFRDEGVWSLLKDQDAQALSETTLSKVLTALPTYEVDHIYVCAKSAAQRNLSSADFVVDAELLDYRAQSTLIAAQDAVIGAQS